MQSYSVKDIVWDSQGIGNRLPEEISFISCENDSELAKTIYDSYGTWPKHFEYKRLSDEEADEIALKIILGACFK